MVQTNAPPQFDGPLASAELATRLARLVLASFDNVQFAVCFGSFAREESTTSSDIDLMVALAASPSDLAFDRFVHAFIDFNFTTASGPTGAFRRKSYDSAIDRGHRLEGN